MNNKYLRELRRCLRCSRKTKKRLLERFAAYQHDAVEAASDYDQMVTMFGPPEEMARILMEEVTQVEACAYRRRNTRLVLVGIVACVLWVFFTFYVFWIKTIPIQVIERTYVHSEIVETTSPEG